MNPILEMRPRLSTRYMIRLVGGGDQLIILRARRGDKYTSRPAEPDTRLQLVEDDAINDPTRISQLSNHQYSDVVE